MAGKEKKPTVEIKGFLSPEKKAEMFSQRSDAVYDSIFEQCSQHLGETLELGIIEGENAENAKANMHSAMSNRNLKAARKEDPKAEEGKFSLSVRLSIDGKSIGITLGQKEPEKPK